MAQLKSWISASRLRTLPLSISGAIVGSSYAYFKDFFDAPIFILIILTTLSFHLKVKYFFYIELVNSFIFAK